MENPTAPQLEVAQELSRGENISIIALVNGLVREAHALRASDIHIDPSLDSVSVRLRIDGVLRDMHEFPRSILSEVVSRIKVLSGLRTDEHQAPQDGRFRHTLEDGGFIDLRVSIMPTYHGENVVMRLLASKAEHYALEELGFSEADRKKIEAAIKRPNGMILATGPTGSGKTTTLYTLLKMIHTKEISIVTIEDPIEYAVADIKQIQVNARVGISFGHGLRSILRQDPNVIMVGEIRDAETAGIAVNTALTGHLLLSTLHTNDAATTLPRLLDMGIDGYLVSSTVNIAIGQRLVRKICPHCSETYKVTKAMKGALAHLNLRKSIEEGETLYKGIGCEKCQGSGYSGRVCINEVLVAEPEIREAILRKASANELKQIAMKNGMTTMLEDGLEKARRGQTSIEEILRVINE